MLWAQAETTLEKAANKAVPAGWLERLIPQQEVRWVVWATIMLILVVVAMYVIMKVRGISAAPVATSIDHLTEFQDLHERGAFDDQEMSRLKEAIKSNCEATPVSQSEKPRSFPINKPR